MFKNSVQRFVFVGSTLLNRNLESTIIDPEKESDQVKNQSYMLKQIRHRHLFVKKFTCKLTSKKSRIWPLWIRKKSCHFICLELNWKGIRAVWSISALTYFSFHKKWICPYLDYWIKLLRCIWTSKKPMKNWEKNGPWIQNLRVQKARQLDKSRHHSPSGIKDPLPVSKQVWTWFFSSIFYPYYFHK